MNGINKRMYTFGDSFHVRLYYTQSGNNVTLTAKFWRNNSYTWNMYGQFIQIYYGDGTVIGTSPDYYIAEGSTNHCSESDAYVYTISITLTRDVTVYAKTWCRNCYNNRNGVHPDHYASFNIESDNIDLYYVPPKPSSKPSLSLKGDNNNYKLFSGVHNYYIYPYYKNNTSDDLNILTETVQISSSAGSETAYFALCYYNDNYDNDKSSSEYYANTSRKLTDGILKQTDGTFPPYWNTWVYFYNGTVNETISFNDVDMKRRYWLTYITSSTVGNNQSSENCLASNTIVFLINHVPTMDANKIKVNTTLTKDMVTLSWEKATDLDEKITDIKDSLNLYYKIYYQSFGTTNKSLTYIKTVQNTLSTSISLHDLNITEGDSVKFTIIPGDDIEYSHVKYVCSTLVKHNKKPSPGTIKTSVDAAPNNGKFTDANVIFYLNDLPSGCKYKTWIKVQDESYQEYITTTSTNININCQNKIKAVSQYANDYYGKTFTFRIQVIDSLGETSNYLSKTITRNIPPSPPTTFNYVGLHNDHAENITKISWDASKNYCNGENVPTYNLQLYNTTINEMNANKNVNATYYTDMDITSIMSGNYFQYKIAAIDILGEKGNYMTGTKYIKNTPPTIPTNFKYKGNSQFFNKTCDLTWTASTDINNDSITYKIYFSTDDINYILLDEKITATEYSHNILQYNPGTTLYYKIQAVDIHNAASELCKISKNAIVDTPPDGADIICPCNTIYNTSPLIIFKTLGSTDNNTVKVYITINDIEYNSETHSDKFNKTKYNQYEFGQFKCPVLSYGNYNIKIKTYNGYQYSIENTSNIIIASPLILKIYQNNIILASEYNKMYQMIKDNYKAYRCSFISYMPQINISDKVSANDINQMSIEINSIINRINEYVPNGKFNSELSTANITNVNDKITPNAGNNIINRIIKI